MAFNDLLLNWVEKLTGLQTTRVQDAIQCAVSWRIDHIQRELIDRPSIDTAVATTLLVEAVDKLTCAGIPANRIMTKLRRDVEVWPTWAELRTAALLLRTPPEGRPILRLEPHRRSGKHCDFQFVSLDDKETLNIEFKAIGLSDEEAAFYRRVASYLDPLLPSAGLFHLHTRLTFNSIPLDAPALSNYHAGATRWLTHPYYPAGLAGVEVIGHERESNYPRRLRLRLIEALSQVPRNEAAYAAFYWTNAASRETICEHLNWKLIPENILGILLVGDCVAFPHPRIHSYILMIPRDSQSSSGNLVRSSVSEEDASFVIKRFERSSGLRPVLLTATTSEGTIELLRRDGSRRILPFNLLMSEDPGGNFPRTGGWPDIWSK
jgi:hypothetical protein